MSGGGSESHDAIIALLRAAQRIVLTTHVTPDGDGLGSALALMRALRAEGRDARLINCSSTPSNLRFLVRQGEFSVWTPRRHQAFLDQAQVIVATDIGGSQRLGKMESPVRAARGKKVVIDHHIYENDLFDEALIVPEASSSAEVTYDLLRAMRIELTPALAEPLYVGIASDTGNFCYSATSGRALRIGAELVEAGADPNRVWRKLSCETPWSKMRALGHCLAGLRDELNGRVVWSSVDAAFLKRNEVRARDAFEVVNYFLQIKGVEVGVFFMEIDGEHTKVSLRSAGRVDVCSIAARYGGGGHRFAAGCTVSGGDLDATRERILGEVEELVRAEEEAAP